MRLFIAVPLPRDVQRKVFAFEQALRECSTGGRFVPQGNHHVTLRFIGESNDLADIAFAMDQAVADARPFTLKLGGYGWFDHGGARTSYLKAEGDLEELYRIHEMLETSLWERGFCKGKGRLVPHVTGTLPHPRDAGNQPVGAGLLQGQGAAGAPRDLGPGCGARGHLPSHPAGERQLPCQCHRVIRER